MKMNIEGKIALVTGGGRDIGKEISKTFAAEGVLVAINYNKSCNSNSSRIGEANLSSTAAARGGTIALGKSLAKEFGRANITVNTVSLGLVETAHSDRAFLENNREKIIKSYPLKRIGTPEDVAPIVVFLCSNNASWITGQVVSVNGGFCMV